MNRKQIIIGAVVVAVLVVSAAFAYAYIQGQMAVSQNLQGLMDDHGYSTSLTAYPAKIVSLAPSCTEILFALNLGNKVVAVTDFDNYPYNFTAWVAAGNMTSVGAFDKPSIEVIASKSPDLILATAGVQGTTIDTLRSLGYKVLVLDPTNITGVLKDIELVGKATGNNAEASSLVENLTNRINAVISKVASAASKPKVYYEVWYDPTSLWSAGTKAWENDLIEKAGGVNVFADQELTYFQSSSEAVISRNPDVIVLPAAGMGTGPPFWGSLADVKARPGWNSINAVKNDRLYQMDSDVLSRAGPRVADAVEMLAKFFHPELF